MGTHQKQIIHKKCVFQRQKVNQINYFEVPEKQFTGQKDIYSCLFVMKTACKIHSHK